MGVEDSDSRPRSQKPGWIWRWSEQTDCRGTERRTTFHTDEIRLDRRTLKPVKRPNGQTRQGQAGSRPAEILWATSHCWGVSVRLAGSDPLGLHSSLEPGSGRFREERLSWPNPASHERHWVPFQVHWNFLQVHWKSDKPCLAYPISNFFLNEMSYQEWNFKVLPSVSSFVFFFNASNSLGLLLSQSVSSMFQNFWALYMSSCFCMLSSICIFLGVEIMVLGFIVVD